jgi:hypothetical protein
MKKAAAGPQEHETKLSHASVYHQCLPHFVPGLALPGACLSMVVSLLLRNASRGAAENCQTSPFGIIGKLAYRTNTRGYYIAPLRASLSARIPLPLSSPLATLPNSPLPHQQQLRTKLQRAPLRPQLRHCSHRRTMCRHQREADTGSSSFDLSHGREILPAHVKPIHYHLTLEPNLETFEYKGTVVIE